MDSQKTRKAISLGIIFVSILLGVVIIPALLNIDKSIGLFLGGILGIILLKLIYPENFNETEEQAKIERMAIKQQVFLDLYFFHPTKAPLTLSMVIFVLTIALFFILEELNIQQISSQVMQIGIMSCMFLWGISGFLIISRNQLIENVGPNIRKYKGFWAILNGIVLIIVGWGGIILYALSSIFNW
jgi:hypothetical protein